MDRAVGDAVGDVRLEHARRRSRGTGNVLSTPHITSPSGFPAVSDAFDSIVPVSPATRISTSMPVSAVNSSSASLSDRVGLGERVVGDERDRRSASAVGRLAVVDRRTTAVRRVVRRRCVVARARCGDCATRTEQRSARPRCDELRDRLGGALIRCSGAGTSKIVRTPPRQRDVDVDSGARAAGTSLLTPDADHRLEVDLVEFPACADDRDASARTVEREQRQRRAGHQAQRRLPGSVQDLEVLIAPPTVDHRHAREHGRAERADAGHRVVEPVAATDQRDASGSNRGGEREREFGVGLRPCRSGDAVDGRRGARPTPGRPR